MLRKGMLQLRIEFRDFYKREWFTEASPIRGHKERKEEIQKFLEQKNLK